MGGTVQIIAGIMEFRVGNTFGSTVHCSYGAFWLSYAMFLLPYLGIEAAYNGNERAYTFALGIYLILWSFFDTSIPYCGAQNQRRHPLRVLLPDSRLLFPRPGQLSCDRTRDCEPAYQ